MYQLFCFTVYENVDLKRLWSRYLITYNVSNKFYVYFSTSPLAQFAVRLLSAPGVIVSNQDVTYIYIVCICIIYMYMYLFKEKD